MDFGRPDNHALFATGQRPYPSTLALPTREACHAPPHLPSLKLGGKANLLNAATVSHLVLGFEVMVQSHVEDACRKQNIEVRSYNISSRLLTHLKQLASKPHRPRGIRGHHRRGQGSRSSRAPATAIWWGHSNLINRAATPGGPGASSLPP